MESVIDKQTIIEQFEKLTFISQFIETIFVDGDKGTIELHETLKSGNDLIKTSRIIDYKLKNTSLQIQKCNFGSNIMITDLPQLQTISSESSCCNFLIKNINSIFANEFSDFKNVIIQKLNYTNQNFFVKLFNPITPKKILKKIEEISSDAGWILIPGNFTQIFEISNKFEKADETEKKIIYYFGKFAGKNIFVNPEEKNKFYFGNFESITLVVNQNLDIDENLLKIDKQITKINLKYEFIQNSRISCLEIL